MGLTITGDFAKLSGWQETVETTPDVLADISRIGAEELIDLVQQGFAEERNPYGDPWKPKKRPDGRAILVGKTAHLRRRWHVKKSDKGGFTIAPSVSYAAYHQRGTKRMSKRMMVPQKSSGLPPKWKNALVEVGALVLRQHFKQ